MVLSQSVISINHVSWSLSQPREEHAHLSTKDTSILSTEEEEMTALFRDADNAREQWLLKRMKFYLADQMRTTIPQNEADCSQHGSREDEATSPGEDQSSSSHLPVTASRIIIQRRSSCSNTSLLKTSLYRLQRKRLSPIPTTREAVHFCGEWLKTDAGENFLLVEDGQGDNKIVIIFQCIIWSS